MLGTVLTSLRTMATWMKTRFNAMILNPLWHWKNTGVSVISRMIQSAISLLRAWIKPSKDQLVALSHTLLASSIKVVTTLALLILGLSGLLCLTIVHLCQLLASKLQRRGQ